MELPIGVEEIKKIIPHRYPFLLVDKVIALEVKKSISALKCISISDPILQGHFPDNAIFPGVMVIEGVAQTSAILGCYSVGRESKGVLLTEISRARFRKQVKPGDVLHYKVTIEKTKGHFFWFSGEAYVDNNIVATVSMSAYMS
jgi:3-hydroxyacyl-[acyl-carrier-protein] dehydratase